jgi:hypothetical protein
MWVFSVFFFHVVIAKKPDVVSIVSEFVVIHALFKRIRLLYVYRLRSLFNFSFYFFQHVHAHT